MPRKKLNEIRANRIVLEDLNGKTKALFDATHDKATFIKIYGSERASLDITVGPEGNPTLGFYNKTGRFVLGLGMSDDIGHGISISDSEGRLVCIIGVAPDGIPRIRLKEVTGANQSKKLWSSPEPKRKKPKKRGIRP